MKKKLVFGITQEFNKNLEIGVIYAEVFEKTEEGYIRRASPEFDGLRVRAQMSLDRADQGFYGSELQYDTKFQIGLAHAEMMVKTLRGIENKLKKLNERFGYAKTLTGYLYRVADVIGISEVYYRTEYTDYHNLTFLDWGIRDIVQTWQK